MEAKLLTKESVKAKFEVSIPASEVDKTYSAVFRNLSRQVKIPGFRPGKAPKGVIMKRIGEDALNQEVRDFLVESHYPKAVKDLELSPVHAHFDAKEPTEGSDYSFEVEVELYPEIELPELSNIIIDTEVQSVTDEMLAEATEQLRRDHATLVPVERAVEDGDYIMVETIPDEEGQEGGRLPIDLENVSDSLKSQLIGKAMEEEVELELSPEPSAEVADEPSEAADAAEEVADSEETDSEEAEAPEPVKLKVVIKDIKEKEKPELDDEFAKTLGFEAWEEADKQLRDNLQAQLKADAFEGQREEFIEKLVAETDFDLPESLVNRRKAHVLQNLSNQLSKEGVTLEAYLKDLDEKDEREEFDDEVQESAEEGVKQDLVLETLLEARGTQMTDDEFNAALRYMAAQYGQDATKFRRERGEDWLENYRFLLTRDKAVREALRELLGEDGPVSEADMQDVAEEVLEDLDADEEVAESED